MHRSLVWRVRLDTTTNWAVVATVAILTFSFNNPQYSSETLIAGMYANLVFLLIEARRFRFFDVWRARVRMLEENFYGPILRRDLLSPVAHWGRLVAEDLLRPRFKITYHQALKARLKRNYGVLFSLLLLSWLLKLLMHPGGGGTPPPFLQRMALGPVPWWVSLVFVIGLYTYLIALLVLVPPTSSPEEEYWGPTADKERLSPIDI
jgi:uncharacterized membrane protein